ncbi:4434_t:CDS:2 [Rhizophagus irregularis]|nr:4434_t:CDS:2 [Rhizophagus irregularis]
MPRADRMKRWDYTELVKVLKFLNNNFNKWFENHMEACTAASKNTNIDRDASSIYSKVHTLIKDMENSIEADRSPTLTTVGETSTNQMNQMGSFQMPIVIEEVKTLCNERIQGIETKRKEDIEKISQIQSEMIETLMDANNKINNKCEELKQYQ